MGTIAIPSGNNKSIHYELLNSPAQYSSSEVNAKKDELYICIASGYPTSSVTCSNGTILSSSKSTLPNYLSHAVVRANADGPLGCRFIQYGGSSSALVPLVVHVYLE